jgi:hypothetical protein
VTQKPIATLTRLAEVVDRSAVSLTENRIPEVRNWFESKEMQ